jgi:hypothetical protein
VVSGSFKFYLSFENALCDDYATEKFFNVIRNRYYKVFSIYNYNLKALKNCEEYFELLKKSIEVDRNSKILVKNI